MKRGERFTLQSGLRQQPRSIFQQMYKGSTGGFHDHTTVIKKQHTALMEWLAYWHHPFENRKCVLMPDDNSFGRNIKPIKALNTCRVDIVQGLSQIPAVVALMWPSGFTNATPLARVYQLGVGASPTNTSFLATTALVDGSGTANNNYQGTVGTGGSGGSLLTQLSSPVFSGSKGFARTTKVSYKISCYGQPDEIQGKMRVVYLDRRLALNNPCLCYQQFFPPVGIMGNTSTSSNVPDFRIEEYDLPTVYAKGGVHLEHITHLDEDYVFMAGDSSNLTGIYNTPEREAEITLFSNALPNVLLYFEGVPATVGLCPIQIDIVTLGEVIDHREVGSAIDHVTPTGIPPRNGAVKNIKQVNQLNQTLTPAGARHATAYPATQTMHELNDVQHIAKETAQKLGGAVSSVKSAISRGKTDIQTMKTIIKDAKAVATGVGAVKMAKTVASRGRALWTTIEDFAASAPADLEAIGAAFS